MNTQHISDQPTYKYLDNNFESLKTDLIEIIKKSTREEIMLGAITQANKGIAKYSMTIDQNKTFPAKTYLEEEIFDAFVYLANLQLNQNQDSLF
jgi:hypothetical protein